MMSETPAEAIPECPRCGKPEPLCICDSIAPIENRIALVILQVVVQAYDGMQRILPAAWVPSGPMLDWFMRILLPAYVAIAMHRAYAVGWLASSAASIITLCAIVVVNLYVYRAVEFLVTFALT